MNHSRKRNSVEILVNGEYATKDDFDRLIEEQDCFEISLRHEKARNSFLVKELRKMKKEHRKEVLRLEKEIMQHKADAVKHEEMIKTLEKQNLEQKTELEQYKSKPVRMQFLKQVSMVTEVAEESSIEGEKGLVRTNSERRFKKAASLVAQLVQGFEAAAEANNPTPKHESVRRRRTVHGFRTVTLWIIPFLLSFLMKLMMVVAQRCVTVTLPAKTPHSKEISRLQPSSGTVAKKKTGGPFQHPKVPSGPEEIA